MVDRLLAIPSQCNFWQAAHLLSFRWIIIAGCKHCLTEGIYRHLFKLIFDIDCNRPRCFLFDTVEAFYTVFKPAADTLLADIPNYTDGGNGSILISEIKVTV